MEFLTVAGKSIQRVAIEDDLSAESPNFRGEFDYRDIRLVHSDQSGVVGEGSLSTVFISEVDLSGAQLNPVTLSNVRCEDVTLSNSAISVETARRTEIVRSQAIGLQLAIAHAVDFYAEECRFDYATIRFDKVKNAAIFRRCSFRESVLAGDLSNVVFDDCELIETEFDAARATGCDLTGSRLVGVRGLLALRGARIYSDQASALAGQLAAEAGLIVVP
ncbi:pentapeptide repeat-containing protein [Actinokineospora globicatena]|uniref:pentapeptide repeat-containing protein n=1 Tax=Actinokineospora globicatena TaxID=103729 RepID=UPI0020A2410B|nr:pentapeptide repeat-containing protein [Actinokineospora globicatena]